MFLTVLFHYREIAQLLQDFAKAESSRIADHTSANPEQWSRRVNRVEELGLL